MEGGPATILTGRTPGAETAGTSGACRGELTYRNGNTYEGELVDGEPHGEGTFTWRDNEKIVGVYTGEFAYEHRHGNGAHENARGQRYEGEWKMGEMTGYGEMSLPDGSKHEGFFLEGLKNWKVWTTDRNGNESEDYFWAGEKMPEYWYDAESVGELTDDR